MIGNNDIIDLLIHSDNRLQELEKWLNAEVWSLQRFEECEPEVYIEQGEKKVHKVEELISASAFSLYDEISSRASERITADSFFGDTPTALVIFDGASIRELPVFKKFAVDSGYNIVDSRYGFAALPSDTEYFIEQRILGKRAAPSQLPGRRDLGEYGIKAYYFDSPTRNFELSREHGKYLLWSHFPDGTYKDLSAKFASHFSEMLNIYDTVWRNVVMSVSEGYRIIITSDHGYIFFGPDMDTPHSGEAVRVLDQDRYKFFQDDESLPENMQELQIIGERKLAMLRGRIRNRPKGPSGNRIYRHGGMSLMEMFTPWLVIE